MRVLIGRLLRLGVALVLLYYVISQIGLANLLEKAASVHVTDLVIAFFVFVLVQAISAFRLQWLIDAQGIRLTVPEVLEVNLAARFYGLFLPGETSRHCWSASSNSPATERNLPASSLHCSPIVSWPPLHYVRLGWRSGCLYRPADGG